MNFSTIVTKTTRVCLLITSIISLTLTTYSETLESTNYIIKDATVGTNGQSESTNFSLISGLNPISDSRLTSSSYNLKAGFPNGIIANVPKVICFETNTITSNTTCQSFPNNNGAQGECGYPGCYNRAKLEIDSQNNPVDTLFIVKILDVTHSLTYYLQSDHTLGTTYDISSFMDKCDIQGKDSANSSCDDSSDSRWNTTLQKYNILGLMPDTQYSVTIAALNGDFSGTEFSSNATATTTQSTLSFDIDIAPQDNPSGESTNPYSSKIGQLSATSAVSAHDLIWLDINTNAVNGISVYIKDQYSGLFSITTGTTIPSESEDLATDPNTNGGYGVKTFNYSPSQSGLGPLLTTSRYNTTLPDQVGALSTSYNQLFYTENTSDHQGAIANARAALYIKARSTISTPTGNYLDNITFTLTANL